MSILEYQPWDAPTPPALPSGFNASVPGGGHNSIVSKSASALLGVTPISAPNVLYMAGSGSTPQTVTWGTQDGNSGDVEVQATGYFYNNVTTGAFSALARGSASTLLYASSTFYEFCLSGVTNTLAFNIYNSGSPTTLVSLSVTPSNGIWYQINGILYGTLKRVQLQDLTNNLWLNSSSSWVSSGVPIDALSWTESGISGQGYAGLSMLSTGLDATLADDWTLSTTAPVSLTLSASAGSFALTGCVADLWHGSQANASAGAFSLTGASTPLTWGPIDSASAGSFALAGADATLEHGRASLASAGSFALTGAPAGLAQSNNIVSACGQYSLAGAKAALFDDHQLSASAGSFAISGSSAVIQQPATLNASGGVYSLTGASEGTYANRVNPASCGSYTIRGCTATLTFEGSPGAVGYHIYSNGGSGPVDYSTIVATTSGLTYTTAPMSYPAQWLWAVRAYWTGDNLEETNVDVVVSVTLNASGQDISDQPPAPIGLRAFPVASGGIKVEFTSPPCSTAQTPSGFHCYAGTGTPNYGTVAATIPFSSGLAGSFTATLTSFSNGQVVAIGVRAYNSTGEEQNVNFVTATAATVGPTAVVGLVAQATS